MFLTFRVTRPAADQNKIRADLAFVNAFGLLTRNLNLSLPKLEPSGIFKSPRGGIPNTGLQLGAANQHANMFVTECV